jgi:uncharacterized protein (DUF1697 family)
VRRARGRLLTAYVALLRGINVGGKNPIPMADLREMLTALGLHDARTLLQSGNAVFRSAASAAELETALAARTRAAFGCDVDYFVRSATEWSATIAANPFPDEAQRDPARTVAVLLAGVPAASQVDQLRAWIPGPERIEARERVLYAYYPNGQGTSKLTNVVIERKLALRGTARNWNTMLKIAALLAG